MKRALLVVTTAALLAGACGSSSKPASSSATTAPGSTIAKPKNATVVLLTHDAFDVSKSVLADFTKQTGYKVKLVQPGDAGLVVNQAILRKNAPIGDALFGVDNTFLTRALNAGIFDAYTPSGVNTLKAGVYVDPSHDVTPIDEGDVCVVDDTAWFGHNGRPPVPTNLASLVDPRYKNLLVVENPATSSPGLAFLQATVAAYGPNGWQEYWRKLKANGVRVVNDWTEAYDTDFTAGGSSSGDRPIVVSYGSDPAADVVNSSPHHDTPQVGVLEPTCFRQFEFAGVLHNAKNPDGARALISFMLTRPFQEDMPLKMYVNPVTTDARVPAVYAKWAVIPSNPFTISPQQIGAQRDAWIKEWNDLVVG